MVAPGDERSACWAAKRRRVETVVTQALCRELVHRWRRYAAAESTELAEACVVDQNEYDVRSSFGCLDRLRELWWVAVEISSSHIAWEMKIRPRQYARGVCRWKCTALRLGRGRSRQRDAS